MYTPSTLVVLCALCASSLAAPVSLGDIFPGFIKDSSLNSPDQQSDVVKRTIYDDTQNNDGDLKQISLQSLIGDVESSLFASALSVSSVAHDKSAVVAEVTPVASSTTTTTVATPTDSTEHAITKRSTDDQLFNTEPKHTSELLDLVAKSLEPVTETTTEAVADANHQVLLQTTERVPEKDGVPAHILIDRVSVQPFSGDAVPLIPTFQVKHTQLVADNGNSSTDDATTTQIKITQTDIKTTINHGSSSTESTSTAATKVDASSSATTDASSTASTSTTATPIGQLKAAEEDLKEKVAEIEADPVILSARV